MRELVLGVAAVLAACAVWSLSLLAPELLGIGALGVIAARYPGGGLPSLLLLRGAAHRIDWFQAARFSVCGQVGNYALALTAVRLAGPALVVGIVGMTPVVMAIAERRIEGRPLRPLLVPLAGSVVGLGMLSTQQLAAPPAGSSTTTVVLGVVLAVVSVAVWTWGTIDNGRYLRANPHLSTALWSSATSTLSMLLAAPVTLWVLSRAPLSTVPPLLVVAATVGVGGSWLAVMAFAHGIRVLPPGLAGQLLAVETVLGLAVLSVVRGITPGAVSLVAMTILVASVAVAVRVHAATPVVSRGPVVPRPPRTARAA